MLLNYAALFLIIALVAALFGYSGIAASAAAIGQVLFWVFLIVFAVSLLMGWGRNSWRWW